MAEIDKLEQPKSAPEEAQEEGSQEGQKEGENAPVEAGKEAGKVAAKAGIAEDVEGQIAEKKVDEALASVDEGDGVDKSSDTSTDMDTSSPTNTDTQVDESPKGTEKVADTGKDKDTDKDANPPTNTDTNPDAQTSVKPEPKEKGFMDEVSEYFETLKGKDPSVTAWVSALFGTVGFAIQKLWNNLWNKEGEKKEPPKNAALAKYEGKEPVSDGEKGKVKSILEKMKAHPDWMKALSQASKKYDLGPKGPSIVLAIINQENPDFDPSIPNKEGSSALGLGQFIPSTWDSFLADPQNSEFAGKDRTDPIASIFGVAWLMKTNANGLEISMSDEDAPYKLYFAHHNGLVGAKTMLNYIDKKGPVGEVPGTYKTERGYDYDKYTKFVTSYASSVQANTALFGYALSTLSQMEFSPEDQSSDR